MELKQKEQFSKLWQQLINLSDNPVPEKIHRLPQNDVLQLFKEVAQERVEATKKNFKEKLSAILDAKLALDKTLAKGREDLAKKEEAEYATLNQELRAAMSMMEQAVKDNKQLLEEATGDKTEKVEE